MNDKYSSCHGFVIVAKNLRRPLVVDYKDTIKRNAQELATRE